MIASNYANHDVINNDLTIHLKPMQQFGETIFITKQQLHFFCYHVWKRKTIIDTHRDKYFYIPRNYYFEKTKVVIPPSIFIIYQTLRGNKKAFKQSNQKI